MSSAALSPSSPAKSLPLAGSDSDAASCHSLLHQGTEAPTASKVSEKSTPQPSATTLGRGVIPEMDGLRGIAILLVMVHHFWPAAGSWAQWSALPHLGWIGVDLFFAISGFLIVGILLDTKGEPRYFRNFYARRFLRIFPLYYLFVIAAFVVVPLVQGGSYAQTEFLRESGWPAWYLLFAGNIREAFTGHEPSFILAPLWSLSIEEQFYIVFPLIVAALSSRRLARLLVGLLIFAPIFRLATFLIWPDNERIQYLATPARVDVLAGGALLAVAVRSGAWLPAPKTTARLLLAALALCVVAFFFSALNRVTPLGRILGYSLLAITGTLTVLWALQYRGQRLTSWLRFTPLGGLGRICFGVYLLHRPAEVLLLKATSRFHLPIEPNSLAMMAMKFAAAITVSVLSWYLFEKRILRLKEYFRSPRHPMATAINGTAK